MKLPCAEKDLRKGDLETRGGRKTESERVRAH